eukprot:7374092-Pyramimonas_sp.AAC.1
MFSGRCMSGALPRSRADPHAGHSPPEAPSGECRPARQRGRRAAAALPRPSRSAFFPRSAERPSGGP